MKKIWRFHCACAVASLIWLGNWTFAWSATPSVGIVLQPIAIDAPVFMVVADDIDGDKPLDLIATSRSKETAHVLRQKTPRQFSEESSTKVLGFHANELTRLPGAEQRYVLSAEGQSALKILLPDDQGKLQEGARRPAAAPFSATAFSWPGWGISLAVAPYQGETLSLLRNLQPTTAQVDAEYELSVPSHSVPGVATAVDLNGDGIVELLYTTRRTKTLWRVDYPKDGEAPKPVEVCTAPVGAPRHLITADLNGDQAPDVLLPLESERRIAVLLNDGKGHLTPGPELPVPSSAWGPARLAIAEDRDGSLLLVADTEQSLMFYRIEKGNPYRFEIIEYPLPASLNQILLRDLDGDGELDVVVVLNVIEDALRIGYGPLWQTLTGGRKAADSTLAAAAMKGEIKAYEDPSRVLAQIGDQPITVQDMRNFVMESGRGHKMQSQVGQINILREILDEALLKKAVARDAGVVGPLPFEEYSTGLKRLKERHFPLPPPPDEATLRAYYEIHKEEYGIPEMVRLAQIQFRRERDVFNGPSVQQRAAAALQRLEAGEDFETLAAALTENPRTGVAGSDRGFVARNAEPWLQEALRGLQPGQRTGIVESPVGYEILLIKDWRPPLFADFATVRSRVTLQWQGEQQQQARNRYLKMLAQEFNVTVLDKELANANPANR